MRKQTPGRKYYHKPVEILNGTSIMIRVGSPKKAAEHGTVPYERIKLINGDEQITNRLSYIPFEHTPVSGKKVKENFQRSLKKHEAKVASALENGDDLYAIHNITKTSKIVSFK